MSRPANADVGPGPYRFEIRNTDTDFQDRLHLASLFSLMQESAYLNAEALDLGASRLDSLGLCWLLSRISVRLDRLPHWGNTVWVKTWSRGAPRLMFLRDFSFHIDDPDTSPFGWATSEWLIARQDDHRPQRPDTLLDPAARAAAGHMPAVFDFPCPRLPALAARTAQADPAATGPADEPLLIKYADYSDIDRNRHVNNTRYIAWCMDTVYASISRHLAAAGQTAADGEPVWINRTVHGLDINYLSEVRLGSKIQLLACPDPATDLLQPGGGLLVEGRQADSGVAVFRARVF